MICPLIISSFSCTIFSDIVCCLLSNVCVVTSFYQSLQAMSSFSLFSICATYCTLSSEIVPFEFVNEAKATMPDIAGWVREEIGENEEFIIIGV